MTDPIKGSSSRLSGNPLEQQYLIKVKDTTYGPYDGHKIQTYIEERRVAGYTSISVAGSNEWVNVETIPVFASVLQRMNGGLSSPAAAPSPQLARPAPSLGAVRTPAAMMGATPTMRVDPAERQYAGFWIRVGAYLIDWVIFNVVVGLIQVPLFFFDPTSGTYIAVAAVVGLVALVFWFLYWIVPVGGKWQATLGKRICGIYIIDTAGKKVSALKAFARYLSYAFSVWILGFGFFMAGWTKEKKALHDLICETRVVYGKL